MTHHGQPEYYTLVSIDPFDGNTMVLGIFENMDAVVARLRRVHSCCGSEYRIECFHLTNQKQEEEDLASLLQSRKEAAKQREEEKVLKERMHSLTQNEYSALLEDEEHVREELATSLKETTEVDS